MKTHSYLLPFAVAGMLLSSAVFSRAATIVTGFEESEGFHPGSVTTDPGSPAAQWSFTRSAGFTSISSAYAKDGSLSLAILGDTSATHYASRNYAPDAASYNSLSWSFTNPDAAYTAYTTTSWMIIYLKDASGSTKEIDITTQFGGNSSARQVVYNTWDASGKMSKPSISLTPTKLDFSQWNTLSVDIDYTAKTYTLNLNGSAIVSDIAFNPNWNIQNISGIWLVNGAAPTATPGNLSTTYYDGVAVSVPEPKTAMALLESGVIVGGCVLVGRLRKKQEGR